MKSSQQRFLRLLTAAFAALVSALMFSGCQSSGASSGGYYSRPPVAPIDGATTMQNRIGQIQRSFIR